MSKAPFFTILIPSYNQADYLGLALDSLLAQSFEDWEAVVANDGSTDHTESVLAEYAARDTRISYHTRENGGCPAALNTALEHAKGDWICWLSSDDLFETNKLEIHADRIREFPGVRFFHTHFSYLYEETGEKAHPDPWRPIPDEPYQVSRHFEGNYIHGNAICIHRSLFEEAGNFDESLRCGQDFDMWLRLSRIERSRYQPERTCVTRWHVGQTTNDFPVAGLYDSCRACLKFINAHPFEEYFPVLDLTTLDGARGAARETLAIGLWTGAYVYQLGYDTALLDRLREWVWRKAEGPVRDAVLSEVRAALDEKREELPGQIVNALEKTMAGVDADYRPRAPREIIDATLADSATPDDKKRNLLNYIEKLKAWSIIDAE